MTATYTHIQTDKGKQFYNERVHDLLWGRNIIHFRTEDDTIKASVVERFNRTLRGKALSFYDRHQKQKVCPQTQRHFVALQLNSAFIYKSSTDQMLDFTTEKR